MTMAALERVLRHDRILVIATIVAVTVLAWAYIVSLAGVAPAGPSSMDDMPGMDMAQPTLSPWNFLHFAFMFAMWSVMMLGMMLPSVTPMVLIYARVARQALVQGKPFAPTAWFVGGYLVAWFGFSLVAVVAQWALESLLLLTPMGRADFAFGGLILIGAGLYQWLPLKGHCLSQCQSPLLFLQRHGGFQHTSQGSFLLGTRHGLYCVGCCWALMLLLFVAGIMNLLWIAGLAVIVLIEKTVPAGRWLSRFIGICLVLSGVALSTGLLSS
jgi:predicted metal-binding membrane protein